MRGIDWFGGVLAGILLTRVAEIPPVYVTAGVVVLMLMVIIDQFTEMEGSV